MRMSKDTKARIKRMIRDAIALNPMISLRELQRALAEKKITIGNLNSLSKLRAEITEEALAEVDRSVMSKQIALMKERNRLVTEKLFRIVFWDKSATGPGAKPPSYSEQIAAASAIVKNDLAIFQAELDAGVFKKGPLSKEEERWMRNRPLSTEQRESIENAMRNFGMVE